MKNTDNSKSIASLLIKTEGNLNDDRYEIETVVDPEGNSSVKLKSIQGAEVKTEKYEFKHHYDYILDHKIEIHRSRLILPDAEFKLSEIFNSTPYGLIDKGRTGIGATTLELKSKRNSIIVVPTQVLALNKVESSKNKNTGKYGYLYVGGRIDGKKFPSIEEYINDESIEFKKLIVVADSFPKLEIALGESLYVDYFLMVDEIDSYQYDSHYRPALEDIIDYYFRFSSKKRCLLTATLGFFSHPDINKEPLLQLSFPNKLTRNINLIHTNDTVRATVDKILETHKLHPNDKILIAYNSIEDGIQKVIALLNDDLKKVCKVLCSIKSASYIKEYYPEEKIGTKLPDIINFMTSSYFVGIDIEERFHLISVSDAKIVYTLLSEDKHLQILGRCRHKKGVLSETIIYKTIKRNRIFRQIEPLSRRGNKNIDLTWDDFRDLLLYESNIITSYKEVLKHLKLRFSNKNYKYDTSNEELIKESTKTYLERFVTLVRENIEGDIVPAYFNIDSMVIQYMLLYNLYIDKNKLKDNLIKNGNNVTFSNKTYDTEEDETLELYKSIEEENKEIRELELSEIIEILRRCQKEHRVAEAGKIRVKKSTSAGVFLDRFIELEKYVEFEELVEKLSEYMSSRAYNNFFNSTIFWALDDKHPLKIKIKNEFKVSDRYTNFEVADKISRILSSILDIHNLKPKSLVEKAKNFVELKRVRNRVKESDDNSSMYKVISYNVNNFKGKPLTTIPDGKYLKKEFKF